MKLLIVESPAKSKTILKALGSGWEVAASFGHVRDLPTGKMGVSPPQFVPEYVINDDRGKATVAKLRKLVANAEEVFLATDPDREGEAIAWHLKQALSLKSYQRVTFNEITAAAIQSAMRSPRQIDMKLVSAQESRRVIDRIVGYTVSPVLGNRMGETLSAGRVQSPTLRILVDLDRRIEAFVPEAHFGARIFLGDGDWHADWNFKSLLPEGQELWKERVSAVEASLVSNVTVEAVRQDEALVKAPYPFTTSSLQQAANRKLGLSAKQSMQVAQKLYEAGLITYMRTDSTMLSDQAVESIRNWLTGHDYEVPAEPNRGKNKEGAQEAHEAIRPADVTVREAGSDDDQRALYRLIWERAVASQMLPAKFEVTELDLISDERVLGVPARYAAKGRRRIFTGWQSLTEDSTASKDGDDDDDNDAANPVPAAAIGERFEVKEGKLLEKMTKAPSRLSEADLVSKLENLGIGRPSTYASIIETLLGRGYIVRDTKKKFQATDLGKSVVDALVSLQFAIMDLDYTRRLEKELDKIADGTHRYIDLVASTHKQLETDVERLSKADIATAPKHECPACKKPLRRLRNKVKKTIFWGCTGYPQCEKTMQDLNGSPVEHGTAADGNIYPCPKCEKPLRRMKGQFGAFWGCSGYPDCSHRMVDKRGRPVEKVQAEVVESVRCPKCESPMAKRKSSKAKKGQSPYFYGCTKYPDCDGLRSEADVKRAAS